MGGSTRARAGLDDPANPAGCGAAYASGGIPEASGQDDDPAGRVDWRESLANDRKVGAIGEVALPRERITRLRGIMIDLDPKFLRQDNPLFPPADDPREFLEKIRPALERHPLVRDAEVRCSGSGLHALIWLGPAVELHSAGEQEYWDGVVEAVQASLPSDPHAPGITAMTRPVGSVNGKNGATVEVLRPGRPVEPSRVVEFVGGFAGAPFRRLLEILAGVDRVTPCPICRVAGGRLAALDRVGNCYECGKVDLARLFDAVLVGRRDSSAEATGESAAGAAPGRRGLEAGAVARASVPRAVAKVGRGRPRKSGKSG